MYEDNNKSYSITAEQAKEVELKQEKEFIVYYLRKALGMVGDMKISEALAQLEKDLTNLDIARAFKNGEDFAEKEIIEKACNWIIDNFVTSDIDDYGDTSVIGSFTSVQSMIEDFQKAMEGGEE